jgi:hypothetical protein
MGHSEVVQTSSDTLALVLWVYLDIVDSAATLEL